MADMKKIADAVSNALNCFGFDSEQFCYHMGRDHRTLQQNLTRLCFAWIKHCAREDYPHDDRNRASHVKCKAIVETMSSDPAWDFLPYI